MRTRRTWPAVAAVLVVMFLGAGMAANIAFAVFDPTAALETSDTTSATTIDDIYKSSWTVSPNPSMASSALLSNPPVYQIGSWSNSANCLFAYAYSSFGARFNLTLKGTAPPIIVDSVQIIARGKGSANRVLNSRRDLSETTFSTPAFPTAFINTTSQISTISTAGSFATLSPGAFFAYSMCVANLPGGTDGTDIQVSSLTFFGRPGCKGLTVPGATAPCSQGPDGSGCTISCQPGFVVNNGVSSMVCNAGFWTPTPPTMCVRQYGYCAAQPAPLNGMVACNTSLGGLCKYTCNSGYTCSICGDRMCKSDTSYTSSATVCNILVSGFCTLPPAPANGGLSGCGSTTFQAVCPYVCDAGYIPASTAQMTCGYGTVFTGTTPACIRNSTVCPLMTTTGNTYLVSNNRTLGGISTFGCQTGFMFSGSTRTCTSSGAYAGTAPPCNTPIGTYCPGITSPLNGTSNCQTTQGTINFNCSFTCNANYTVSNPWRICTASKMWSGPAATCIPDYVDEMNPGCETPSAPVGGYIGACNMSDGGSCTFGCNEGYTISGNALPIVCNASEGIFNGSVTCTQNITYCSLPPAPTNGSLSTCQQYVNGKCMFTCTSNFYVASPYPYCLLNGTWSNGGVMTCLPKPGLCPIPPQSVLNTLNGSLASNCSGTVGSACALTCFPGYTTSNPMAMCVTPGAYTISPCVPIASFCPVPSYANATTSGCSQTIGSTCLVTCASGFTGGGTVGCNPTGTWGGVLAPCVPNPEFCTVPSSLMNGAMKDCDPRVGGVCNYVCDPGYAPTSGVSSSVCNMGQVFLPAMACQLIDEFCDEPEDPDNGQLGACDTRIGGTCDVACDNGYIPTYTPSARKCMSDGEYSGIAPQCIPTSTWCVNLPAISDASVTSNCSQSLGGTCALTCNAGFSPPTFVLSCENARTYSSFAGCNKIESFCPAITAPNHGSLGTCSRRVGETCVVACDSGYLPASTTVTCGSTGLYSQTTFSCQAVNCGTFRRNVDHGSWTCSGTTLGAQCNLTCDSGYAASAPETHTCMPVGNWSVSAGGSTCDLIPIPEPPVSAITSPPPVESKGNGGAIAGGIIAVLIVLGIAGGVAAFVIMKKRKEAETGGAATKPKAFTGTVASAAMIESMMNALTTIKIGSGAFATVYKASLEDGQMVALKTLNEGDSSADAYNEFKHEVEILTVTVNAGGHPNVVKMIFQCPAPPVIALELCEGGSLATVLASQVMDEGFARWNLRQVAAGLKFLHENNIVHLDMKPENLLRNADGALKITDFGTSLILGKDVTIDENGVSAPVKFVGTPQYSPPERFKSNRLDLKKADVFAVGVIMWRIFARALPFEQYEPEKLVKEMVKRPEVVAEALPIPPTLSPELRTLLGRTLSLDFAQRPTCAEILTVLEAEPSSTGGIATGTVTMLQRGQRASVNGRASMIANPAFNVANNDPAGTAPVPDLGTSAGSTSVAGTVPPGATQMNSMA